MFCCGLMDDSICHSLLIGFRSFGDHKHCRKILQRAINSVRDYPETVFEAYVNFEREEGLLVHCSATVIQDDY